MVGEEVSEGLNAKQQNTRSHKAEEQSDENVLWEGQSGKVMQEALGGGDWTRQAKQGIALVITKDLSQDGVGGYVRKEGKVPGLKHDELALISELLLSKESLRYESGPQGRGQHGESGLVQIKQSLAQKTRLKSREWRL